MNLEISQTFADRIRQAAERNNLSSDEYVQHLLYIHVPKAAQEAEAGAKEGPTLDLYKLEYQKCVDRYDNIFKAVWTNFSYMAIVTGAILTFGGTKFSAEATIAIACVPLIFWYLASFLPMNRYGDGAIKRLDELERLLNQQYFSSNAAPLDPRPGLHHFTDFRNRGSGGNNGFFNWRIWRVRTVVSVGALLLVIVLLLQLAQLLGMAWKGNRQAQSRRIEIEIKDNSLQLKTTGLGTGNLAKLLQSQTLEVAAEDEQGNRKKYILSVQPQPSPTAIK